MAEGKKKTKVHMCTGHEAISNTWETACGRTLDKEERAGVILTNDWSMVVCKACKDAKPEEDDEEGVQVRTVPDHRGTRRG